MINKFHLTDNWVKDKLIKIDIDKSKKKKNDKDMNLTIACVFLM